MANGRSDYASSSYRDERRKEYGSGEDRKEYGSSYRSEKSQYGDKERSSGFDSRRDVERSKDYGRRDRSTEGRKEYGNRQYGNRQFAPRPYFGSKKFGYSGRNHFSANNQGFKKQYAREDRESTYPPPGWMERPAHFKHNNNPYQRKQERTDAYGRRVDYGRKEEYGGRKEYGRRSDERRDYGRGEKRDQREKRRRDSSSSDRSRSSSPHSSGSNGSLKRRSVRDIVDEIVEKRLREEVMASMQAAPMPYEATVAVDTVPRSFGPEVPAREDSTEASCDSSSSSSSSDSSSDSDDDDDEVQLDPSLMHTSSDGSPLYDDVEVKVTSEGASTTTSTNEKSKWDQE